MRSSRPRVWTRGFSAILAGVFVASAGTAARAATYVSPYDNLQWSRFQPHIGDWLLGQPLEEGDVANLEQRYVNYPRRFNGGFDFTTVDRFIALSEAVYPNLTFVFMGRDTAPLAQAVEVRLAFRGESNRVINLPLSGEGVNAMTESEIVEFLAQQGIRPRLGEDVPPFVLVDRTEYHRTAAHTSQVTKIVSAFYKAFDRLGYSAADYTSKINLIAVRATPSASTSLAHVTNGAEAIAFARGNLQAKLHRIVDGAGTAMLFPETAMWLDVDPLLLDRSDLEWHDKFAKPERQNSSDKLPFEPDIASQPTHYDPYYESRQRALAFTWEAMKQGASDLRWGTGTFLNPLFTSTEHGGANVAWENFLGRIADQSIPAAERFRLLNWMLGLKRTASVGDWLGHATLANLGADAATLRVCENLMTALQNGSVSSRDPIMEMMLLKQFLVSLGAVDWENDVLARRVLDRLNESLDRWAAIETAGGREISPLRVKLVELAMGVTEAKKPSWFRAFYRQKKSHVQQEIARLEKSTDPVTSAQKRAEQKDEVVERAAGLRPDPGPMAFGLKVMTAQVAALDVVLGGLDVYGYAMTGFSNVGIMAVTTMPMIVGSYHVLKAYVQLGRFNGLLNTLSGTGHRLKVLATKSDPTAKATTFLERLTENHSKGVKACVMSVLGKDQGASN